MTQDPEKKAAQQPTIQELLERVSNLEEAMRARDQEREAEAAAAEEEAEFGMEDDYGLVFRYGEALVSFQLFGDVGFNWSNPEPQDAGNSWFDLGTVDLFVNAQIGDHFRLLSETVFMTDSEGDSDLTQMRLWGMWEFNDYLYAKLGTEHSPISRWNQLFHHGRYLETSIRRPFLARFERGGGILPVHATGLELGGKIRPEVGTVEYWGAVSNGRGETPTDRNTTLDPNDSKRVDIGLAFLPGCIDGLRIGGSFTYDEIPEDTASLDPERSKSIRELITATNLQYQSEHFSAIGEWIWIGHETRQTGSNFDSHAGFLQLELHEGNWTPYTRFDYRNMSEGDPFYSPVNRDLDAWLQLFGVRYELAQNVAIKAEFGFGEMHKRSGGNISEDNTLAAGFQLSWSL